MRGKARGKTALRSARARLPPEPGPYHRCYCERPLTYAQRSLTDPHLRYGWPLLLLLPARPARQLELEYLVCDRLIVGRLASYVDVMCIR
jgi:hypothetical protein